MRAILLFLGCLLGCETQRLDPFPLENSDAGSGAPGPACESDDDCDRGGCDPATHTCRESCSSNDDCDGRRWVCETTRSTCVECTLDEPCQRGLAICRSDVCIECYADADCDDERPHCELDRNRCRECLDDDHCRSDERCDDDEHRCETVQSTQ
jgi:hypothetical protein